MGPNRSRILRNVVAELDGAQDWRISRTVGGNCSWPSVVSCDPARMGTIYLLGRRACWVSGRSSRILWWVRWNVGSPHPEHFSILHVLTDDQCPQTRAGPYCRR